MRDKPCLTLDDVFRMVAACRKAAAAVNEEPTIAIVDAGGHLMYLERPDHHRPNGVHMATGKARTASMRARPSSALEARVKERPGFLTVPNALAVRGGVPVFYRANASAGSGFRATATMTSRSRRRAPMRSILAARRRRLPAKSNKARPDKKSPATGGAEKSAGAAATAPTGSILKLCAAAKFRSPWRCRHSWCRAGITARRSPS